MLEIFLKTVPFFLLIGCGWGAAKVRLIGPAEAAALTKFVFYFALSAMLFRFAADLPFEAIFNPDLAVSYLIATAAVYALVTGVALWRTSAAEAAVEAQCAAIGNVGFLGLPMLVILLGPQAAGPIMMILAVDLIVFGSLIVVILVATKNRLSLRTLVNVPLGVVQNPMVMSISAGLAWSALDLPIPGWAAEFLGLLGGAATPGALFAIGASLAARSAERFSVALWLSTAKLALHPAAVFLVAGLWFGLAWDILAVAIAAAAMPTAGNVYIIAQHYGVAPMRASSTILVSTVISVVTLTAVIAAVS